MKASIRALVRVRARQRCEYCRLQESDLPLFCFHIEHILPKKHGLLDPLERALGDLLPGATGLEGCVWKTGDVARVRRSAHHLLCFCFPANSTRSIKRSDTMS